ncbi:hypothetical protein MICRO11B_20036 [Micrococcus luteus]|nr:hypothetical protein MICRO116_890054 [Micrococcus sp. 116]VXB16348.1 hypothetical protein MICRO11B_20036 [Micrococcus luteus]
MPARSAGGRDHTTLWPELIVSVTGAGVGLMAPS